jgi:hypothetical protein
LDWQQISFQESSYLYDFFKSLIFCIGMGKVKNNGSESFVFLLATLEPGFCYFLYPSLILQLGQERK